MKNKAIYKNRVFQLFLIFGFLLILNNICIFTNNLNISKIAENNEPDKMTEIKSSNYLILTPFVIDELGGGDYTWEEAINESWCSGNGTFTNPYVISNLEINCHASSHCIEIKNSNVFFIIEGCKLYSSNGNNGYYRFDYGIYLSNVNNSIIRDNKIIYDYELHLHAGIRMWASNNNTMINNYIKWVGSGIHLSGESRNNVIKKNVIVKHHTAFTCIYISVDSTDNIISDNYCGLTDPFPQTPSFITTNQVIHKDRLLIEWSAMSNVDNYSIFINGVFNISSIDNTEMIIFNENGTYLITVTSINEYGESEPSVPLYIIVSLDKIEPSIVINSPNSNELFGTSAPNFNIEIYDTNLDSMWYNLYNGATNITFTTNGTINQSAWDTLPDGTVTITFYANDSAGNIGFVEVTIRKDVTAPIIAINNPQNSHIIGAIAPNFDISIDELNLDKTWYSLNGGNNITFTGLTGTINQALWDALSEGNIIIRFYANDSAGNIGFAEVTIRKDVTAPIININSPTLNELFGTSSPSFNVEIYDTNLDSMWYTIDNSVTNITFTSNGTINQAAWNSLPEGNVVLRFYANDTLGRIEFAEVTIRKDVNAPIIAINNPQNSDIIGVTAPSFDISIEELNLDKTWYSLNGGNTITFTELTGTINQALWDALSEGNVIIRFYANDTLGRVGFQEVTVVKTVSQSNPPGIPGYNILLLLGIVSVVSSIIIKKKLNHLN